MTQRPLETTEYPRVLIVSNDCLSQHTSNGRTLRNFLPGWPREKLAQFYMQNGAPDFEVCGNYFCVTDGQALRAFLGKGCSGGSVTQDTPSTGERRGQSGARYGRSALTMLARELVWRSRRWQKCGFPQWADAFQPEVILLQGGDFPFLLQLAEELSRRYDAPLVVYSSESDYFKGFDYFQAKGLAHWCYPVFRGLLCRQYRSTMARAVRGIYICEALRQAYDTEFGLPSTVLYTATEVTPRETTPENPVFRAAYLGNLGLGRHISLMEIGKALHHTSEYLYLDVYGAADGEVLQALEACPGIRYHGLVPYEDVLRVMAESDLLVHAESFDAVQMRDLRFAFSTKIPDSLASGACFLVYAPEGIACVDYLKAHQAAWVVSHPAQLHATLQTLVEDPAARRRYLAQAATLVKANHHADKNTARFQALLKQAANTG